MHEWHSMDLVNIVQTDTLLYVLYDCINTKVTVN